MSNINDYNDEFHGRTLKELDWTKDRLESLNMCIAIDKNYKTELENRIYDLEKRVLLLKVFNKE